MGKTNPILSINNDLDPLPTNPTRRNNNPIRISIIDSVRFPLFRVLDHPTQRLIQTRHETAPERSQQLGRRRNDHLRAPSHAQRTAAARLTHISYLLRVT